MPGSRSKGGAQVAMDVLSMDEVATWKQRCLRAEAKVDLAEQALEQTRNELAASKNREGVLESTLDRLKSFSTTEIATREQQLRDVTRERDQLSASLAASRSSPAARSDSLNGAYDGPSAHSGDLEQQIIIERNKVAALRRDIAERDSALEAARIVLLKSKLQHSNARSQPDADSSAGSPSLGPSLSSLALLSPGPDAHFRMRAEGDAPSPEPSTGCVDLQQPQQQSGVGGGVSERGRSGSVGGGSQTFTALRGFPSLAAALQGVASPAAQHSPVPSPAPSASPMGTGHGLATSMLGSPVVNRGAFTAESAATILELRTALHRAEAEAECASRLVQEAQGREAALAARHAREVAAEQEIAATCRAKAEEAEAAAAASRSLAASASGGLSVLEAQLADAREQLKREAETSSALRRAVVRLKGTALAGCMRRLAAARVRASVQHWSRCVHALQTREARLNAADHRELIVTRMAAKMQVLQEHIHASQALAQWARLARRQALLSRILRSHQSSTLRSTLVDWRAAVSQGRAEKKVQAMAAEMEAKVAQARADAAEAEDKLRAEHIAAIADMQSQISASASTVEELMRRVSQGEQADQERAELQQAMKGKQDEIESLKSSLASLESSKSALEAQVQSLQTSLAATTPSHLYEACLAQKGQAEGQLQDCTRQLEALQGALQSAEAEREAAHARADGLQSSLFSASTALHDMRAQCAQVGEERSKLEAANAALSEQLIQLGREASSAVERAAVSSTLARESEAARARAQGGWDEAERASEDAKAALHTVQAERDELAGRCKSLQSSLAALDGRVVSLESESQSLSASKAALEDTLASIRAALAAAEARERVLEATCADLSSKLDHARQRSSDVSLSLAASQEAARTASTAYDRAAASLKAVQGEKERADEHAVQLSNSLQAATRDIARLSADYDACRASLEGAQRELAEVREQAAETRQALQERTAQLSACTHERDHLRMKSDSQGKEIEEMRREHERATTHVSEEHTANVLALTVEKEQLLASHAASVLALAAEKEQLLASHAASMALLRAEHAAECAALRSSHAQQVATLQSQHEAARAEASAHHAAQVSALQTQCEMLKQSGAEAAASAAAEVSRILASHESELSRLAASAKAERDTVVAAYESELAALRLSHDKEAAALRSGWEKEVAALRAGWEKEAGAAEDKHEAAVLELGKAHATFMRQREEAHAQEVASLKEHAATQLASSQAETKSALARAAALEEQLQAVRSTLEQQCAVLKQQVAAAQQQAAASAAQVQELQAHVEGAQREVAASKVRVEAKQLAMEAARAECTTMRAELQQARAALAQLQQEAGKEPLVARLAQAEACLQDSRRAQADLSALLYDAYARIKGLEAGAGARGEASGQQEADEGTAQGSGDVAERVPGPITLVLQERDAAIAESVSLQAELRRVTSHRAHVRDLVAVLIDALQDIQGQAGVQAALAARLTALQGSIEARQHEGEEVPVGLLHSARAASAGQEGVSKLQRAIQAVLGVGEECKVEAAVAEAAAARAGEAAAAAEAQVRALQAELASLRARLLQAGAEDREGVEGQDRGKDDTEDGEKPNPSAFVGRVADALAQSLSSTWRSLAGATPAAPAELSSSSSSSSVLADAPSAVESPAAPVPGEQDVEQSLLELSVEAEAMRERVRVLEEQLQTITSQAEDAVVAGKVAEEQVALLRVQLAKSESLLSDMTARSTAAVEAALEEARAAGTVAEQCKAQLQQLMEQDRQKAESVQQRVEQLASEKAAVEAALAHAVQDAAGKEGKLRDELREAQSLLAQAQAELVQLQQHAAASSLPAHSNQTLLQAQFEELQQAKAALESRLAACQATLAAQDVELRMRKRTLQDELDALRSQLRAKYAEEAAQLRALAEGAQQAVKRAEESHAQAVAALRADAAASLAQCQARAQQQVDKVREEARQSVMEAEAAVRVAKMEGAAAVHAAQSQAATHAAVKLERTQAELQELRGRWADAEADWAQQVRDIQESCAAQVESAIEDARAAIEGAKLAIAQAAAQGAVQAPPGHSEPKALRT